MKRRVKLIRFTAQLLGEARKGLERQLPRSRFYIFISPHPWDGKKFVKYLEEFGVSYLNYTKLFWDYNESKNIYHIGNEWRTNSLAHRVTAGRLVKDLNLE